jgi:hypothetical protein
MSDIHDQLREINRKLTDIDVDINQRFAVVEAKLDAKPSVFALYQAVVTLMFGIAVVITSTVVVLKNLGFLGTQ